MMTEHILSGIYIYPIKSASGLLVKEAEVEERGLKYDRRWMIVDADGKFISQRTHPEMSLLSVGILGDGLVVSHKTKNYEPLFIPFDIDVEYLREVEIWDDKCSAVLVSNSADCWFSKVLNIPCQLVYMPDESNRLVDSKYSTGKEIVSFADAYPFLLTGQSSLDDLNSKLNIPVSMNRFRPNLVFNGGTPFIEDSWKKFEIGSVTFFPVKPCARCSVITVNQETGLHGKEPLNVLSSYRTVGNKILFGQNLIHNGKGKIRINDSLKILE